MDLRSYIVNQLNRCQDQAYFNKIFLDKFRRQLEKPKLTKAEGTDKHFDAMFVPVYQNKEQIFVYLGHHKKADDWIPPGGHIEPNELPEDTVVREFQEELNFQINKAWIKFFNITVKEINRPDFFCMTHFDLWHFVKMKRRYPFKFLPKEYYDADWFPIKAVTTKIKHNPWFLKTTLSLLKILG